MARGADCRGWESNFGLPGRRVDYNSSKRYQISERELNIHVPIWMLADSCPSRYRRAALPSRTLSTQTCQYDRMP